MYPKNKKCVSRASVETVYLQVCLQRPGVGLAGGSNKPSACTWPVRGVYAITVCTQQISVYRLYPAARPISAVALVLIRSLFICFHAETNNSNFGLLSRQQREEESPRPVTGQSQAEEVDIDALRPQTTDKDGQGPTDIENPADSPTSNPLDVQRTASNGAMDDSESPEAPLTRGQSGGK